MNRQVFTAAFIIAGAAITTMYSNCSQVAFSTQSSNPVGATGSTDPGPGPTPPVVCDPFDNSNVISSISGLKGSIYYLDPSQPRYTSSIDVVNNGHKVNADLFLNSLNVPTRAFSAGFASNDGTPLQDGNGNVLIEYFGLSLKSSLKLGVNDQPGTYEVAVLSDDGSTMMVSDGSGGFKPFINNEGAHETTMGCTQQIINMTTTNRLPISLTYFQGPRYHIALVMMWRHLNPGQPHDTSQCGQAGNTYFWSWDATNNVSVAQAPVQSLLANGWKILTPDNFELSSGTNKCSN